MTNSELERKSVAYRKALFTYIFESGSGHTGGSLSSVDIINVLYNGIMDITPENWNSLDRDFYVQSKGHSVEALYVILADRGFFPVEELKTGNRFGSRLIGHPTRSVPGVEQNTGGLGHGLSFSVGLAIAAALDGRRSRIFCLLGDGELAEGSNWEAAMSGSHHKLDNLIAIVDRNQLQITGRTEEVNELEPLADKWRAFGWAVRRVDGNSVTALLENLQDVPFAAGSPSVIIADTVKGKGISFVEGNAQWHHKVPDRALYDQAIEELSQQELSIRRRSGTGSRV